MLHNSSCKPDFFRLGACIYFAIGFILITLLLVYWGLGNTPCAKKVAFVVHTESLGGRGVYELYTEMKKVGHDVKILAIPLFDHGDLLARIDLNFTAKFDKNDVLYPCGMKQPYARCALSEPYKFDYIFVQNPYDIYENSILEPTFVFSGLKKLASKVMYIPYAPHIFHVQTMNDIHLDERVDVVFADSESTKKIYIGEYWFPRDRIIVSGYQPYKSMRQRLVGERQNAKETILWLPRWFLSFQGRHLYESGSTFLNYHYFFYNYARKNPDIDLIIRPHRLLFEEAVSKGHLSQADLDDILRKFNSLKNVKFTEHALAPLSDDILKADIVISDGTAALADVVVADKPIIYLSNGWNAEFNSSALSEQLRKYVSLAYEPQHILTYLDKIREANYKPLCDEKERARFRSLVDPVEDPDKFIAEYLLNARVDGALKSHVYRYIVMMYNVSLKHLLFPHLASVLWWDYRIDEQWKCDGIFS